jgi:hypothetical protein
MMPATEKPTPQTAETTAKRFKQLADKWEGDVAYLSSMGYDHPAYGEIISMGPEIVPLLLRDMEQHHTHWFHALRQITGVNPVPNEASGNIPEMVDYWLKWGRENGYPC